MKYIFPKDFIWGVATAAQQIEGAHLEDGRGLSIWDAFSYIPGNIAGGGTPFTACDSYHKFDDDLKLLKELGVNSYRYSISWSRVLPEGKGKVNQKGLDYYKRITDKLLENSIMPNVTLYHWDLPYELERYGGWVNRDSANWFADYANVMFDALGDKVPMFATLNEPIATYVGYAQKGFAPGFAVEKYGKQACHNIMRAHGAAVQNFRSHNLKNSKIGVVVDIWNKVPLNKNDEADIAVAKRENENSHLLFLNGMLKGKYSDYMLEKMQKDGSLPEIKEGDMTEMCQPLDFWGMNVYSRNVVSARILQDAQKEIKQTGGNFLDNGQEYYPQAVYENVKLLREEFGLKIPVYITENGTFGINERETNGIIEDKMRIDYVKGFLKEIERANKDGLDIRGYYLWSIMDNFEWSAGYTFKFGLCSVDEKTFERKPKRSFYFYKDVIKNNGLDD